MPALSLRELEQEARRRLEPAVYDFFAGGAGDERTLRANESAFAAIGLVPRVLRGAGRPALATSLLGCGASLPVLLAPTAFHRLAHPEGERASARAAAAAGTIMIASMASTLAVEEVAAAAREAAAPGSAASLWFQLYVQPDRGFTEAIVRRAETAGCSALVLSVDSPVLGRRERDLRNGFLELPPGMCCENLREPSSGGSPGRVRKVEFSPELSWKDVEWLRGITRLPLALKGVVHPDDARLALRHGVAALVVSNHGGRQLDGMPASVTLLPAVADAVEGAIPLLVDGGVRRGGDVVKALALGARAVAIGRPVLWGLAVAGESGVRAVIELLRDELEAALMLCGVGTLDELGRGLLRLPAGDGAC
jgi:4-hydroxymandelate oxidase